jgi:hypothetical protein
VLLLCFIFSLLSTRSVIYFVGQSILESSNLKSINVLIYMRVPNVCGRIQLFVHSTLVDSQLIRLFEVFNKRYIYHTLCQENSTWMGTGRIRIKKKKGNNKRPGERLDMKKSLHWNTILTQKKA